MKITRKLVFLSAGVAMIVGAALFVFEVNRPPADFTLVELFHLHHAEYERLRDMLLVDNRLLRVASWGVDTSDSGIIHPPEGNFPRNRYDEYMRLLQSTGARWAFRDRGDQTPIVGVGMWAAGFGGDTKHIEICWVRSEPVEAFGQTKHAQSRYEHIEGNWYLRKDF